MMSTLDAVQHISDTYDELPYISKPFAQTHPDFLRAVCSLFDFTAPAVENANILEIGCAFGGNIIPLAQQFPKAKIIGLDLSPKQIAVGQNAVKTMQLNNIELLQQDITTYDVPTKRFDYIICHGVYSWVPEPVRQAILQVISKGLNDNGVAFVSYNTYPGWKIREVYRDAMRYRSTSVESIQEKVHYGFGMLDFFKAHLPKKTPWGVAINQYYDAIRQADPSYVAHEYLEVVNDPFYFHEFIQSAKENKLAFIAETDFQNHFFSQIPLDEKALGMLKKEANGDIIRLEQLHDYLSNRTFRQTILSHQNAAQKSTVGKEEISYSIMNKLHINGSFIKQKVKKSKRYQWLAELDGCNLTFQNTPVTQFIFNELNAKAGRTVSVHALWQQANQKKLSQTDFYNCMLELIIQRAVNIRTRALTKTGNIDKPTLSQSNRALLHWLQKNPDTITLSSIFHEPLEVDVVMEEIAPLLDGTHKRSDLYTRLVEAANHGRMVFSDNKNTAIKEPKALTAAAKEHVDNALNLMQSFGLLQ